MTSTSRPLLLAAAPPMHISESASSENVSPPSKKKASVACSACRRRKSRCTEGTPCQACKAHNTQCIKDESEDMRRRFAVKKRLESAEIDRSLLDSLLEILRIGNPEQINSFINLVRSNVPRHDLQAFLNDGSSDSESPTHSGSDVVNGDVKVTHFDSRRQRRRTGGIADLMNPPLQLKAKPWTTVTDDDDFVSHLISLWFTWAHDWWHWVDRTLFIEAMNSQDLNNPLCAPYLVNMILADACLLDALAESEDEPHSDLRDQFYAESKKGLDAEQGRICVTVVQTLGVQWTYLDMDGQDKLGLLVLNEQVFMAKELDKYQAKLSRDSRISRETLSKVEKSIDRLEWALFTLNAFTMVGSRRAIKINAPKRPHPVHNHEDHANTRPWVPYPRRAPHLDFHEGCHFACMTSLAQVGYENETFFINSEEHQPGSERSYNMQQRLRDWANSIPPCMRLHQDAMPHVLALYAVHNWIILIQAKQVAAANAGQADKPTLISTASSSNTAYWQQVSVSAAITIGHLMDLLITKWGVDNFPVILIHPMSVALLTLLENVEHEGRTHAFVSISVALRAASRRFRVGKGVLKLVKNTAAEMGVTLPKEAEQLYLLERRRRSESLGPDQWEEVPTGDIGMQYLLEKWDDLNLELV